jgi:hypothetical protein
MRTIFLSISLFFSYFLCNAQVVQWAQHFGNVPFPSSTEFDDMFFSENVVDIEFDKYGNLHSLINIYIDSNTTVGGVSFGSSINRYVPIVLKQAPDGAVLSVNMISASPNDLYGTHLAIDTLSNFYIAAHGNGITSFEGTFVSGGIGFKEFIVKYDSTFSFQWFKQPTLSSFNKTQCMGLEITTDQKLVGAIRGEDFSFNGATVNGVNDSESNVIVFKMNGSGVAEWNSTIVARENCARYSGYGPPTGAITLSDSNDVFLVTLLDSSIINNSTLVPSNCNSAIGCQSTPDCTTGRFDVIKFSSSGQFVNRVSYSHSFPMSSTYQEYVNCLDYEDSKLYVAGSSGFPYWGTIYFPINNFYFNDSLLDSTSNGGFLLALDDSLNLVTSDLFDNSAFSTHSFCSVDVKGDKVVLGGRGIGNSTIGNLYISLGLSTPNGLAQQSSFALEKNLSTGMFSLLYGAPANTGESEIMSVAISPSNDYYFGGRFERILDIDTFHFSILPSSIPNNTILTGYRGQAYTFKIADCTYINSSVSVISGDTFLCNGESAVLEANATLPNASYQWKFGSTNIVFATDTVYTAPFAGDYYVRVSDSTCYMDAGPITINSGSNLPLSFSLPNTSFCVTESAVSIATATPSGGTYFGSGISGTTFSPTAAGAGIHDLGYTYTQTGGCIDTVYQAVQVSSVPGAIFIPTFTQLCAGDSVVLNSGYPSGGTYGGPAVAGNIFAPTESDTGNVYLTYTVDAGGGCTSSDSIPVQILPNPTASLSLPFNSICESAAPTQISGGSPSGGTYSGVGVSGTFFIPQIISTPTATISYTINSGACSSTAIDTVVFDTVPQAVLPLLDSICASATDLGLSHGWPTGGTYFGPSISNNNYTAQAQSGSADTIGYSYQNTCGFDTAYNQIQLIDAPASVLAQTPAICFGDSNGTVSLTHSNEASGYSFSWNNGQSQQNLNAVPAGFYSVTAAADRGCRFVDSIDVLQPNQLVVNLDSADDVLCNGFVGASAFVTVSGGIQPYTYSWSNGETVEDATNLPAGSNVLTVTDSNGCETEFTLLIQEAAPVVISTTKVDVQCFGESNGSIVASATGGNGDYNFNWSNGDTSMQVAQLFADTFTIQVTDTNGCFDLDTVIINQPDLLTLSLTKADISCHGLTDANAQTLAFGGNGAYQYLWTTGDTTSLIDSLGADSYSITVTDSLGCTKIDSIEILEPALLTLSIEEFNSIDCNGNNNGALSLNASGGIGNYAYQWNNGSVNTQIDSLAAGTYMATVTDSNGCLAQDTFNLNEPAPLTLQIINIQDPLCFGDSNGSAEGSISGGTLPYAYSWSSGGNQSIENGLNAGSYAVTVSDSNGCSISDSIVLVDPPAVSLTLSATDPLCFQTNTGQVTTQTQNTTGSISYAWSTGATTNLLDSAMAGWYTVSITDSLGCFAQDSVLLSEPSELMLSASSINNDCFNGTNGEITGSANGGTLPYTFAWSNGGTDTINQQLSAGSYQLTITDANGCSVDTSITISEPTIVDLSIDSLAMPLCFGSSDGYVVSNSVGGVGTYSFLWSDGGTDSLRTNLTQQSYTLSVTDGNGCVADTSFVLSWPAELVTVQDSVFQPLCYGDSTGFVSVIATGGIGNLNYLWSNGDTTESASNLGSTTYQLTVTDENGCQTNFSKYINWPSQIISIVNKTNSTCENDSNGSATATGLGGTGSLQYLWNTGSTTNQITGLVPQLYLVTISDASACEKIDSIQVGFNMATPLLDTIANGAICEGDTAMFVAVSDAANFSWSDGSTDSTFSTTATGQYWVKASTGTCFISDTFRLIVNPFPQFDLGQDTAICADSLILGLELTGPDSMLSYQWTTGNVTQTIVVNQIGTYGLLVVDENGCAYADNMMIDSITCVGIADVGFQNRLKLYPNPNRGTFVLESDIKTRSNYELLNSLGQRVSSGTFVKSIEFNTPEQASGIYFLLVESEGRQAVLRVIKE